MQRFNGVLFLIGVVLVLIYLIFRPHLARVFGLYATSCENCTYVGIEAPRGFKMRESTTRLDDAASYYYDVAACEKELSLTQRYPSIVLLPGKPTGFSCRPEYRFEWGW